MPRMNLEATRAAILEKLDELGPQVSYADFRQALVTEGIDVQPLRSMAHQGLLRMTFANIDGVTTHVVEAVGGE